jgi:ATP-binding cassette subfamily B multidrug efflux pump
LTSLITKIKNFNFGLLSRILGLAKPYRLFFYLSITIGLVIAPIAAYRPYLIKTIIDDNIKIADSQGVINNSVLFIGLLILETILSFAFGYLTFWLGQSIIKDLRNSLFNHIIRLELTYFDKTPIGNSTTRTISDIETINAVFSEGIITIFIDIITLLIVFGMMLFANWKLTLVCISVLPLLILASYYFKEAVKKSFTEVRSQIAIMNSFLQERIAGMKIIQIFNLQSIEKEKLIKINKDYTDANIKSIFAYSVFFPAVEIISAISIGLLVWYGSFGILKNQITYWCFN